MTNMPAGKEPEPGAFAVAVSQEVRHLLTDRMISGNQLAGMIKRSQSYMSKRLRGESSFSANDLETICQVLDKDLLELLTAAVRRMRSRRT
jgi:transcriptional regulator with XRE-family HTH domain